MQEIITYILVAGAIIGLLIRLRRSVGSKGKCSGCSGCSEGYENNNGCSNCSGGANNCK